jgi:4-amino-4-deoxy-L-arabinose transferase-like glycosyltransferase
MTEGVRRTILLTAMAVAVLFFRLGEARLWDRDEPRNARCAIEMLQRNDWVVPYFNAELRTHKPVLLYWLMMTAYAVLGENEFAARFWSAALGVGTVLCTQQMGKRLFSANVGFWSAACLIPALMFNVAARAATPDSLLIFLVAAAMMLFVEFTYSSEQGLFFSRNNITTIPRWSFSHVAWFYGTLGLAVLAKGPVGFVLPMGIVVITLWLDYCSRRSNEPLWRTASEGLWKIMWQLRLPLGIAIMLLVAAPWYAWVGWRTDGEFLRGFFWEHNVRRATESMENHSGSPLFFYPVTLLIGFFPASVFTLPTLLHVWNVWRQNGKERAAMLFCLLWIAVFVGLFSLAGTKLPSYVTPCYPALALLVGFTVEGWLAKRWMISSNWMLVSLVTLGLVGAITIPALQWVTQQHLPGSEQLAWIGLFLFAGSCGAFMLVWRDCRPAAASVALLSGLLFSGSLFGLGSVAADGHQQQHVLFEVIRAQSRRPEVASWHCLESSWVYYLGEPIHEFPHVSNKEGAGLLSTYLGESPDRFVIVRARDWQEIQGYIAKEAIVLTEAPYFLKKERLLVIGSRTPQRMANRP